MAERITRPTVRLAGGLPDGALSNLEALGGRLLSDTPPDVYALTLITRHKREENDDQDGAELAICKVRTLEAFDVPRTAGPSVFPFDIKAGTPVREVLDRIRADRTGVAMLPTATDREAADMDNARAALRDWAAAHLDEGVDALAAQWNDYFGDRGPAGTVTAWRDAPLQMIREFLLAKGEEIEDPMTPAVEPGINYQSEGELAESAAEDAAAEQDDPPARALASVPVAAFAEPGGDHA